MAAKFVVVFALVLVSVAAHHDRDEDRKRPQQWNREEINFDAIRHNLQSRFGKTLPGRQAFFAKLLNGEAQVDSESESIESLENTRPFGFVPRPNGFQNQWSTQNRPKFQGQLSRPSFIQGRPQWAEEKQKVQPQFRPFGRPGPFDGRPMLNRPVNTPEVTPVETSPLDVSQDVESTFETQVIEGPTMQILPFIPDENMPLFNPEEQIFQTQIDEPESA